MARIVLGPREIAPEDRVFIFVKTCLFTLAPFILGFFYAPAAWWLFLSMLALLFFVNLFFDVEVAKEGKLELDVKKVQK